jgi:hypothetical protein
LPESVEKLKVGELIVSEKMMLWKDGDEDASLLIQNGGMLAKTRIIGQQICGNAVLANVVLTTPDSPMNPLEQCAIFTEMGSSPAEGGMLTVRSPDGANVLSNQEGITRGLAYTVTYDNQGRPVCVLRSNDTGQRFVGTFVPLPPGQEGGTIAISVPPTPPHPTGQPMETSQQIPPGLQMNPMSGSGTLTGNPPSVPNPAIDQQAMGSTPVPR